MKGLDTNVLVRYLTQDDPKQSLLAEKEIEGAVAKGEKLVIQPVVICELIWVLEGAYEFTKSEILPVLDQIMRTAQFEVVDKDSVWEALSEFASNKGDFSDYYIGHANKRGGATITLTFDRSLRDSTLFSVL